MGDVGYLCVFVVFMVIGVIGFLMYFLIIDFIVWLIMWIVVGFCIVGSYMVIEVWLYVKLINDICGCVMGMYCVVDMGVLLVV